jgi:hypothetical protein
MAISKVGLTTAVTGTLPTGNGGTGSTAATLPASLINNTSIGSITALPSGVGGKILQIVTGNHSGQASTTSTSFQDLSTNTNISITPSATSSKIYVICQWNELYYNGTTSHYLQVTRAGSRVMGGHNTYLPGLGDEKLLSANQIFMDSPSTTSSIEYKMQFRSQNGTAVVVNQNSATTGSSITLMEIGA